jgi:hypothetical protein
MASVQAMTLGATWENQPLPPTTTGRQILASLDIEGVHSISYRVTRFIENFFLD